MEDPAERTKRMRKELLEKVRKHEKESRESQAAGKIETPKYKRGLTLSLLAIAVSLYGLAIYSYKKGRTLESMTSGPDTDTDTKEGDTFDDRFESEEKFDPELLRDDKSW